VDNLVKFKLLHPSATLPKRGTDGSGGFDFFVPEDGELAPGEKKLISSGVAHDLPPSIYLQSLIPDEFGNSRKTHIEVRIQGILFDRSGLGSKKGIRLSFTGLIDNDYRGEIKLSMENVGKEPFSWKSGERLCQIGYALLYAGDAVHTDALVETARGAGGFGSTGR
jgi:dUTP pyrophosphatase